MVYIYGVTHGGWWRDWMNGRAGEIEVVPTQEFIRDLRRYPSGTKVGIEALLPQEMEEVREHITTLPFNPPEPRDEDGRRAGRPGYERASDIYWERLGGMCAELGFEVVFLEDKNVWFKYNEAIIKLAEGNARRNLLVVEEGESDEHYDERRLRFNADEYIEAIVARKIHEIDRDNALLRAIKSNSIDIAVAGIGHADYWMANTYEIAKKFGVTFNGCSTERPARQIPHWKGQTIFTKDDKPDLESAFERVCLERTCKAIETGRLTNKVPDMVGTWDVHDPYRGYFELFIDKTKQGFSGEIVDGLGEADFEGRISDGEMQFVKRYREGRRSSEAVKQPVTYRAMIVGNEMPGFFAVGRSSSGSFYATREQIKSPFELALRWNKYERGHSKELKALAKRFFNPLQAESQSPVQHSHDSIVQDSPWA